MQPDVPATTADAPADPDEFAAESGSDPGRLTRRALAGGVVGVAATVAASRPAAAATGESMTLGESNDADLTTILTSTDEAYTLWVRGSTAEFEVLAESDNASGSGVKGVANLAGGTGAGVVGEAAGSGSGVQGQTFGGGVGVTGEALDEAGTGVRGRTTVGGTGVVGEALDEAGTGVHGIGDSSTGYGGVFESANVPLRLVPRSGAASGPPNGIHLAGELFVDSDGGLYLCTADGSPGTWTRLDAQGADVGDRLDTVESDVADLETRVDALAGGPRFLPTPQRAFDSRAGKPGGGAAKGAFGAGETRLVDLTVDTDVPSGSTGVLLNLTVVNTTGSDGFVSVYSGGVTLSGKPSFSTINWFGPGQVLANTTSTAISASRRIKVFASGVTDVLVDVIASYA